MNEQLQIRSDAMLVLTSLTNILDSELTRHLNQFRFEKKKVFNELCKLTSQLTNYTETELTDEVKQAVEQFSGYFHELITDLNNHSFNKNQLSITVALCFALAEVYYKYVATDNFKHKILFEQIANNARLFAKLNINSYNVLKYSEFFKEFTITLIERKEFEFDRNDIL